MVCNHRLAEDGEEVEGRKENISFFEGRGASSVDTFSLHFLWLFPAPLYPSFLLSRPAERTTINERIKALLPYYSLRPVLVDFFFSKANDEREDKLVGK